MTTNRATNRGAFINAAKLNASIMNAVPKPVSMDDLKSGDVIFFKDPARRGFPNVDAEIGVVHTIARNAALSEREVMTILPIKSLGEHQSNQPYLWMIGASYGVRQTKIDMGLNPEQGYKIGSAYRENGPVRHDDKMRFVPAEGDTLGTDNGRTAYRVGSFAKIDGFKTLFERVEQRLLSSGAAKQFVHDVNRVDKHRKNLGALAPRDNDAKSRPTFAVVKKGAERKLPKGFRAPSRPLN